MKILGFRFGKDKELELLGLELVDKKSFRSFIKDMDKEHSIRSVECTMNYQSDMLSIKIDSIEKLVNVDTTDNKAMKLQAIESMKNTKNAFDSERKLMMNDIKEKFNIGKSNNDVRYIE